MPIYEYRCSSCGKQQEVMQKINDPVLTICTQCGKPTLVKMLTAAGFQLKGSGWYATDFKGKGSSSSPKETNATGDQAGSEKAGSDKAGSEKGGSEKGGSDKGGSEKAGADKAGGEKKVADSGGAKAPPANPGSGTT
ncbi:MAG: zinc ribbon domain-containing protein [Usitatibacter sp.]